MRSGHEALAAGVREEGEHLLVTSPSVGLWRGMPEAGAWLAPGASLGWVEVLGAAHPIVLPAPAGGRVIGRTGPGRSSVPVGHGDPLLTLDTSLSAGARIAAEPGATAEGATGLLFPSPMSGRFYRRAGPDKPLFVEEGEEIGVGHTLCLLEVMKTFNRIAYGGAGLPERARVVRVIPRDGDDLEAGDPIVEVEPA